jgi:hypothetical protein
VEHPPRADRQRGARIPLTLEIDMSTNQFTESPVVAIPEIKFSSMTIPGKIAHVLKIFVFFMTAGFAFPNILDD